MAGVLVVAVVLEIGKLIVADHVRADHFADAVANGGLAATAAARHADDKWLWFLHGGLAILCGGFHRCFECGIGIALEDGGALVGSAGDNLRKEESGRTPVAKRTE